MTWLSVSARDPRRGSPVDSERFRRTAHTLAIYCDETLGHAFDGAAWLRKRFPARSLLSLDLRAHEGESVVVERPLAKGKGVKEISCAVGLPAAWFAAPGDGLLAVRMLRACLTAMTTLGEIYELGAPPLRPAGKGNGGSATVDPFVPFVSAASPYDDAARTIGAAADAAGPRQLVVVASTSDGSFRRRTVVERLGTIEGQLTVPALDGKEFEVWTVNQHR